MNKQKLFLFILAALALVAVTGPANATGGFLGLDSATLFSGAGDDVKSFGSTQLGIAIIVAVFGFVFAMVHRR
jgi:hypothetical protein